MCNQLKYGTKSVSCTKLLGGLSSPVKNDLLLSGLELDSRKIRQGFAFIAIKGESQNGEQYIESAIENGAVLIIADEKSRDVLGLEAKPAIEIVFINNLKRQLPTLLENFYGSQPSAINVIGVTGTNGKSTVVSFIRQLLSSEGAVSASLGTLGYQVNDRAVADFGLTTPSVIDVQRVMIDAAARNVSALAMEVSSHAIDQQRIANVKFNCAVLTNITQDHLDYHGNFDNYLNTKLEFLLSSDASKVVVVDEVINHLKLKSRLKPVNQLVSVSAENNTAADFYLKQVAFSTSGTRALLCSPWGEYPFQVTLLGRFNLENVLLAIASIAHDQTSLEQCLGAASRLNAPKGRLQNITQALVNQTLVGDFGIELPTVLVDYAHTPDALEKIICTLKQLPHKNLIVVFGCGGDRDRTKRPLMTRAASHADIAILTSDNPRGESQAQIFDDMLQSHSLNKWEKFDDRDVAIKRAIQIAGAEDIVVIAGKGHEEFQTVKAEKFAFSDIDVSEKYLRQKIELLKGARQ